MPPVARGSHPPLRQAQLVVGALAVGVVMATTVMAVLRGSMASDSGLGDLLGIVAVAVGATNVGAYVFLRGRTRARLAESRDEALELLRDGHLPRPIFTLALIGAALAEGAGLIGAVGLVLGGSWFLLVVPVLAVLVIALGLPTRARAEEMIRAARP